MQEESLCRRTFPRARSAPSKNSITPSSMNRPPKVVSATPISGHTTSATAPKYKNELAYFAHRRATLFRWLVGVDLGKMTCVGFDLVRLGRGLGMRTALYLWPSF
jgi:hypothetical protein